MSAIADKTKYLKVKENVMVQMELHIYSRKIWYQESIHYKEICNLLLQPAEMRMELEDLLKDTKKRRIKRTDDSTCISIKKEIDKFMAPQIIQGASLKVGFLFKMRTNKCVHLLISNFTGKKGGKSCLDHTIFKEKLVVCAYLSHSSENFLKDVPQPLLGDNGASNVSKYFDINSEKDGQNGTVKAMAKKCKAKKRNLQKENSGVTELTSPKKVKTDEDILCDTKKVLRNEGRTCDSQKCETEVKGIIHPAEMSKKTINDPGTHYSHRNTFKDTTKAVDRNFSQSDSTRGSENSIMIKRRNGKYSIEEPLTDVWLTNLKKTESITDKVSATNIEQILSESFSQNDSLLIHDAKMEEEISRIRKLHDLSSSQVIYLVKKNESYLREIFQGKQYSRRHEDYKIGGNTRTNLNYQFRLGIVTEAQEDKIMETLVNMFCKKHSQYLDYIMKVMLPEVLIQIYMHVYHTTYPETEDRMSRLDL